MLKLVLLILLLLLPLCAALAAEKRAEKATRPTVACYYFPNYHPGDPRNEAFHGHGWSEWELVKAAKPRFPGHVQPNLPQWGYTDESNPKDMAQKIDAAADHGVDAFIYDWYWYDDGPFLQRGLENGFLKAKNRKRLKFALMWANHDWIDIHPKKLGTPDRLLYPGRITPKTWDTLTDYVISHYFKQPNYWKVDRCPYFSVYELYRLVQSFGGVPETRAALDRFRAKVKAAGFPDLHLNGVTWGVQILPGEKSVRDVGELVRELGLTSVTSYVWIHHVQLAQFPQTPYREVMDKYFAYAAGAEKTFGVPYYPNVTMGWDSSPRANQSDPFVSRGYPFMATMSGNTPEAFHDALVRVRDFLSARPPAQRIFTINCWNEWTEGSYLEPDTRSGTKYLEAIKSVFPPSRHR